MKKTTITALLVTAAFGSTMTPAFGQVESSANPENETQVYTPDYFTQFAPQTAADMVARLPGFEIRGREGGERGFGQASLNILINGRRPSSKSSGANQILGRIPASNVTRIEIVDGATLDIPGLSGQVANIIAKTGELSGSWNYAVRFEKGSQPQLGDGGINFSAKTRNLEAVGSLDLGQFIFTEDGDETFFNGDGNITQDRVEKLGFNGQRPSANLNLTLDRENGDIGNLNLSALRQNRNTTVSETFLDRTDSTLSGASLATIGEDRDRLEISGDYSFDLKGLGQNGRLKLIALHSHQDFDVTSRFLFNDDTSGQFSQLFLRNDLETEYIARAEYTWKTGETSDWALSLEGAINELESDTEFSENGGDIAFDSVRVEEDRAQVNLSRSWSATEKLNIQASLGAEYSVLEVLSGDNGPEKFFRPKGFVAASYGLAEDWTLRAELERSVGQLDFGDFVSDVSLAEGTANQGSQSLVPQQSWETGLELEHQNSTGLSGRAKIFFNVIEDRVEQLLFETGNGDGTTSLVQGPGNLDTNVQRYGIEGNLTWVLDDTLKGLRLTAEGLLADSTLSDPITGESRPTSRQTLWEYEVAARWDINGTPFALEAEIEQMRRADVFRIDERLPNDFIRPSFEFSLIHKDLFGMQWTLKAQNIIDFEFRRQRFVFDEDRRGELLRRELTRRKRGQRISIEVTDTF
ncbi:MAG: TonB-dependent receptor plug domain-containing protein [Litorimonas sp.]